MLYFLLGLPSFCKAQIIDTLYYTEQWEIIDPSYPAYIAYFRIAHLDTGQLVFTGKATDYYADGSLLATSHYNRNGRLHGSYKSYFSNGNVKNEGQYSNGKMSGIWRFYYSNGTLQLVVDLTDPVFKVLQAYDILGDSTIVAGTGSWRYTMLATNNDYRIEGNLNKNQREGTWTIKNSRGQVVNKEVYKAGKFKKGTYYDNNQKETYKQPRITAAIFAIGYQEKVAAFKTLVCSHRYYPYLHPCVLDANPNNSADNYGNQVFRIVEIPPKPRGGVTALYNCIERNIKYPAQALQAHIEGQVYVEFIVEKNGILSNFHVSRGIGSGCDEEALRVVQVCNLPFIPARQRNKPVRSIYVVPIS